MVSLFLLLCCNLSYIVDLFAGLHELASATARTLLKLASSVRALLKPYGDTLRDGRLQELREYRVKILHFCSDGNCRDVPIFYMLFSCEKSILRK